MNLRFLISSLLALICLGAVWAVISQHQQLGHLQAERQAQLAALSATPSSPASPEVQPAPAVPVTAGATNASELLQLRSEVTRLTQQRQVLATARADNEQLRVQLAARATNAAPGTTLPPGFIRRTQARMVGYNSPQDVLQTLLWGVQNRDFNTVLQSFTAESAQKLQAQFQQQGRSLDDFFRGTEALVGLAIIEQKQLPDGTIEAKVVMGPDDSTPQTMKFQSINGQWKVAGPF